MAPQYVKPYVKTNKNDLRDAEAIAEAVTRPSMRFVPIKNIEQHDLPALHRVRARLMGARTALVNEMRGLLAAYGIVLPPGVNTLSSVKNSRRLKLKWSITTRNSRRWPSRLQRANAC